MKYLIVSILIFILSTSFVYAKKDKISIFLEKYTNDYENYEEYLVFWNAIIKDFEDGMRPQKRERYIQWYKFLKREVIDVCPEIKLINVNSSNVIEKLNNLIIEESCEEY